MTADQKPPRQAIRRTMTWPTRVIISVAIPLAIGIGIAATGTPRKIYNSAGSFWALTGLYDPTPVNRPARSARTERPPISGTLRYVTEGVLYTVLIVPAFVLAIVIYDRLTFKYMRDGHIRCNQCGQILQGLTEPRCPECGTKI